MMRKYDEYFPRVYGFAKNKGYGTKEHMNGDSRATEYAVYTA